MSKITHHISDLSVQFRDKATLFLMGFFIPNINGVSCAKSPKMQHVIKLGDLADYFKPMHLQATNIYKCKDERWYQLHESFDARPILKAIDVADDDVPMDEAYRRYSEGVARWDSDALDDLINNQVRQAGAICYDSLEEFLSLPQVCSFL